MLPAIEAWARNLISTIRVNYGVDPLIYLGLCVACAPPFYTALFFLLRAIARKDGRRAATLVGLCIFIYFFPGFYLIFFGHDLPWWVWATLAVLVGWGVVTLFLRIRRAGAARDKGKEGP